ncbi:15758_t:CDS:2, partial [Gigaspora rosea]
IIENNPRALNEKLKNYITNREFWANVECLYKVLEPTKIAVKTVESSNVNKRCAKFDTDFYLLAYFLHPKYRGRGLTSEMFERIVRKALIIWKSQGGRDN